MPYRESGLCEQHQIGSVVAQRIGSLEGGIPRAKDEHALVGAAAMVPGNVEVPRCAMALGVPAKIREDAVPEFHAQMNVDAYTARGAQFREQLRRLD